MHYLFGGRSGHLSAVLLVATQVVICNGLIKFEFIYSELRTVQRLNVITSEIYKSI